MISVKHAARPLAYLAVAFILSSSLLVTGCTNQPAGTNTNTSVEGPGAATATNSNSALNTTGAGGPLSAKEPESYDASITINAQYTGGSTQKSIPPLQFEFAKMGNDRRASFQLPSIGQVIYLEKGGVKYAVFPGRREYAELNSETLGFQLPNLSLMTPSSIVDQLRSRTQSQDLGPEEINGKPAEKYRFAGQINTGTSAGTVQTDSTVYADQATGLPVRAEIVGTAQGGQQGRAIIEMRNVQLNPDPTLFNLPTDMRKVSSAEVKQQVQQFADTVRLVVSVLMSQMNAQTPPASTPPATAPPANTNANRP